MLACFINSACLFCSASFIGPAALDAPWAFLATLGLKLYERKENCLWNSLCNLLVLFLFLRMSISQSIFFCKASDVCLIDKIYKPIEKNISKIISTPQDKSWCAAQICHLLLLDNRTTAIIYMQTVVTFFITSYLQQNSCMSNDATADISLSDRWSL
ncbi:hypothetical protein T08_9861 [Trichinella sp. T8]|nr:hypothetical protein T08_9861 [Trichinella sp. T8]